MADTIVTPKEEPKVTSIASAVTDAVKAEVKEEIKEEVKETPKEEKKEEKKSSIELSEDQRVQAAQLFTALNDPEKAPVVIKFLAEQAGYTKVETKQEAKEIKDEVVEILKQHLGEDFDFLAPKLAPAIKQIVDTQLKENTKDIRETLDKAEETKLQTAADNKQKELAKEYFDTEILPDDILDEMSKMMDKISPTPGMDSGEYIEHIFYAVAGRRKLTPATKTGKAKTEANSKDAVSRLASSGAKQPVGVAVSSNKMSLDESVKAAIAAVKGE